MAVPVRRRRARGRKMTGRMAEVKAKYTGEGPKAHGLRRKGRTPGSGATARSPRARGGSSVTPPVQPTRLTGIKARLGSAAPGKSLQSMRAAAKARTSGGSSTPGTGPTPATTPAPKGGTRGKSALAASRTGRPPAHGARRQGKNPGARPPSSGSAGRIQRGGPGGLVGTPVPVGSAAPKRPKVKAAKLGRGRGSY